MRFKAVIQKMATLCTREIFGFISPSVDVEKDFTFLNELIEIEDEAPVKLFEEKLSDFLGGGDVITFAAGRMSFYALLKCWGVGKGDEVALTGFTCSVMVNAVLRTGANPIYVDIDPETLGMSPDALRNSISERTKVVVAQHTFGIPCEIDKIQSIAKEYKLYLVEDCAISMGSFFKGKQIGNWGDAAIFSTDHTKPLNTLVGGFVYTQNRNLAYDVRKIQEECDALSKEHQRAILRRYLKEHQLEQGIHNYFVLNNYWNTLLVKMHLSRAISPYLEFEASTNIGPNGVYPFPAKMAPMQAKIGLQSLEDYKASIPKRKERLIKFIRIMKGKVYIPKAYFDNDRDIVPLRFAFTTSNKSGYAFIDDWVWFKQPIVASGEPLENFGYRKGMCPASERIGNDIMNFPILMNDKRNERLIKQIKKYVNGIQQHFQRKESRDNR